MRWITAIEMEINGVKVKAPKVGGITEKVEKVWSSNTGRTTRGKMVGTIKCIKKTYAITWTALTKAEKDVINEQVSNINRPFGTLTFREPDGTVTSINCYFGTPTFEGFDLIGGQWRYKTATVDAIER